MAMIMERGTNLTDGDYVTCDDCGRELLSRDECVRFVSNNGTAFICAPCFDTRRPRDCSECGVPTPNALVGRRQNRSGTVPLICLDCMPPVSTCRQCGHPSPVEEIQSVTIYGNNPVNMCRRCRRNVTTCPDCGNTDFRATAETARCRNCYNQQTTPCENCGQAVRRSNLAILQLNGAGAEVRVCHNCVSHYIQCGRHATWHRNTANSRCADCEIERRPQPVVNVTLNSGRTIQTRRQLTREELNEAMRPEAPQLTPTRVMNYTYKPRPAFHFTVDEQAARRDERNTMLYGIELELEANSSRDLSDIIHNIRRSWWYAKSDSSIHYGFEMVTHPMSLGFIKGGDVQEVLQTLRELGCVSHNADNCGMHVHMSKHLFSSFHLAKFQDFIYRNPVLTLTVSQRIQDRLEHYASLSREDPALLIRKARRKVGNLIDDRHIAINLQNAHTVEIRLFRGNLRWERFMKNVEYCQAVYDYSRDASLQNLTEVDFRAWLDKHHKTYPYLHTYLVDTNINPVVDDESYVSQVTEAAPPAPTPAPPEPEPEVVIETPAPPAPVAAVDINNWLQSYYNYNDTARPSRTLFFSDEPFHLPEDE